MKNLEFVSVEAFNEQAKRVEELEHIAELAMQWSANYDTNDYTSDRYAANTIYDACVKAGIGQSEEEKNNG